MNKQEVINGIQAHIDDEDARSVQLLKELASMPTAAVVGPDVRYEVMELSRKLNECQKNKIFLGQWLVLTETLIKDESQPHSLKQGDAHESLIKELTDRVDQLYVRNENDRGVYSKLLAQLDCKAE